MFKRIVDKIKKDKTIEGFKDKKEYPDRVVAKTSIIGWTLILLSEEKKINGLGKDNCKEIIDGVLGQRASKGELKAALEALDRARPDVKRNFYDRLPDKGNPQIVPEPHIADNVNNQFKKYRKEVLEKVYSIAQ